ncbi:MAG: ATP-binding protein, partial [Thermoguttaceae bacterium]|nr:ATP-binding protein [Thermoguttaceae bacterium]
MFDCSSDHYQELTRSLAALPTETEWVEFKVNNFEPDPIAKYISGLSNMAALCDRPYAYLVWGIRDDDHKIVGTSFEYRKTKRGSIELELWLTQQINPKIDFKFHETTCENEEGEKVRVTILEVPRAENAPTKYGNVGYIRVGSNLKPLTDFKDKEAELWRKFDRTPAEKRVAYTKANDEVVAALLDYPGYYRKLGLPIPANREKVLQDLKDEKFIIKNDSGTWDVTNYGALMIATDLTKFDDLSKRCVRVIRYPDKSRLGGIG